MAAGRRIVFIAWNCRRVFGYPSRIAVFPTSRKCHASAQHQSNENSKQNPSQKKVDSEEYFCSLFYHLHPDLSDKNSTSDALPQVNIAPKQNSQILKPATEFETEDGSYSTDSAPITVKATRLENEQEQKDFGTRNVETWKKIPYTHTSKNLKLTSSISSSLQNNRHPLTDNASEHTARKPDYMTNSRQASEILTPVPKNNRMRRTEYNSPLKDGLSESNSLLHVSSVASENSEVTMPLEVEFVDQLDDSSDVRTTDIELYETALSPLSTTIPEFLDDVAPAYENTFNFASYVNRSESLQQLVKLGVDLSKVEKTKGALEFIIKLDFEKDMSHHIQFLNNIGVPVDELGKFVTANPFIFRESLDDLNVRIQYLKWKKFEKDAIARIISKAPQFLSLTTVEVDERLGFFQKMFSLKGDEVRCLVTRMPKVVLINQVHIREMTFTVKEVMGFNHEETRTLLLSKPKIWTLNRRNLAQRFHVLHNEIGIPHQQILGFPGALLRRKFLVKQRHLYLRKLQRDQYDPTQPGYVSLEDLVSGTDAEFCTNIAKTSVEDFNSFLKTL